VVPAEATIEVKEDVDGGPHGGFCRWVRQRPPPRLKKMLMAGRRGGALSAGPAAATAEVEDDVDGEPPGGRCRRVRQQPPPRLNRTSIASPLEMLPVGQAAAHQ
jgi:hypothetical protein